MDGGRREQAQVSVAVVAVVQVVEPAAAIEGVAEALKAIREVWVALDRLQLALGRGRYFLDAENHLRPPELPQQLSVLSVEPFVLPDQRRVWIGLPTAMRRRQGFKRGHITLLSPCRKRRKTQPFVSEQGAERARCRRLVSLAKDSDLSLAPERRRSVFSGTAGRRAALCPASSAAAVVGGTPVVPSPPSVPPITATRSPIILSSPSAGLLGL